MSVEEILAAVPTGAFVGGEFRDTGATLSVVNPATGETFAAVADAGAKEGIHALDAAVEAAEAWASTEPRARAEILRRAFDLVTERTEAFATLMTLEMGKPLAESRGEVTYGAEFLRWFAEEAVRIDGRWTVAPNGGNRLLVMKQPVGPTYAITPWNFPLAMGTRKIAPALAAGCTFVIKPASKTPLTMLYLMQTFADAGVRPGVVNCVVGSSSSAISKPILEDPRLRKLTFTGSTEVGRTLLKQASEQVLRTSMELGGNAPFLVLSDADVDASVTAAMTAKFRNNGEACTAANRFYVHKDLVQEFTAKFTASVDKLVLGDGLADTTTLGPLIDQDALDKVQSLVDDAVAKGATVLTGGGRGEGAGFFMQPTVLADVPLNARLLKEEIFGPVAPIVTVDSDDDALTLANDTEFGLISYVMARDISLAIRAAERIESGMVALNTGVISNAAAPFGGMKQSGLGREGSHEGIEEYLETKYLGIAL